MALRKIVIRGDEILTKNCKPVSKITDRKYYVMICSRP